ncbi:MAG: glycosyltransferase [bacterium]|nr:glycosyltransferase [bacterium]
MRKIESISIISAFHNENKNLEILYEKLINTSITLLNKHQDLEFIELILIDDGSDDNSLKILLDSVNNFPIKNSEIINDYKLNQILLKIKLIIIRLKENFGQSYAISTGFQISKGDIIITIDSDLQNDPTDIIKLFENFKNNSSKIEVLSGYRKNRDEGFRVIVSIFGNKLIQFISGYNIKDVGCSLKAYTKESIKNLKLPYGYHRFLPIISFANKNKIENIEVNFNNRIFGKSHYGYSRIFWLLARLLTLYIIKQPDFHKISKKLLYLKVMNTFIFIAIIISLLFKISYNLILIPLFVYNLFTIKEIKNFINFQNEDLLENAEIVIESILIELIKNYQKITIK